MIMNMRTASYLGKVTSRNLRTATVGEMVEAATLAGSRALGRNDIGRLAPGALADINIVDLARRDVFRYTPTFDPVKALVECGVGEDVAMVVIDGMLPVKDGEVQRLDIGALRDQVQRTAEATWANRSATDIFARKAEEMSPSSFPVNHEC
jgi:5-methylthioadenosine/S-adenosylhomocysteine deaminase